jgi:hypothetical protein
MEIPPIKRIRIQTHHNTIETANIPLESESIKIGNLTQHVLSITIQHTEEEKLIIMPGLIEICLCTLKTCVGRKRVPVNIKLSGTGNITMKIEHHDKNTIIMLKEKDCKQLKHLKEPSNIENNPNLKCDWSAAVNMLKTLTFDLDQLKSSINEQH